ncbi:MAG: DUF1887 family protein [Agathobacter sp.]|nr:DUF1887 family protein [Agathobacter sp.]
MYVNIEFLDTEQIENVITALHHKVDKTIFIGYEDVPERFKEKTAEFLRDYCDVKEIVYKDVSKTDLYDILQKLREVVDEETNAGNQIFFDITGGEGLILVAFGMLAKEYSLPIHQYDIITDEIHEMNTDDADPISTYTELKKKKVALDLDTYIKMKGAVISSKKVSGEMDTSNATFIKKTELLWDVLCDYKEMWNKYAELLSGTLGTKTLYADAIVDSGKVADFVDFENYLAAIQDTESIHKLRITTVSEENEPVRKRISFFYDSEDMKRCLIKAGNVLELHTYQMMKKQSFDCKQSIMIDWDGVEHKERGKDVLNEVDVISIKGNVPVFISCKGGKMDEGQALEPMYELSTVANRFGGKYAQKVLSLVHPMKEVNIKRAEEMNIELRYYGKEDKC